jgi:phage-related protein
MSGTDESLVVARDKAKLGALFQRMADSGRIHNVQKFKKVEGMVFEFKSFQIRIGCFQERREWFLTHGFMKKQDKWPRRELERAQTIRDEHLALS